MNLTPIGFRPTKLIFDEKKIVEIFKYNSVKTKIDVDAQINIGIANNGSPPIVCIEWFHYTKFQQDVVIDYSAEDCYLCNNLDNFEHENEIWDKIISDSYSKLITVYAHNMNKFGKGTNQPSFTQQSVNALRENIIRNLKKKI